MFKSMILIGCFLVGVMTLDFCTHDLDVVDSEPQLLDGKKDQPCTSKCLLAYSDYWPRYGKQKGLYEFKYRCASSEEAKMCSEGFIGKSFQPYDVAKFINGLCCDTDLCTKTVGFKNGKLALNVLKKSGQLVTSNTLISTITFMFLCFQ